MTIQVLKNRTVGRIKYEFSSEYPYLKLEFLKRPPNNKKPVEIVPDTTVLSHLQPAMHEGVITLTGTLKVSELEKYFRENFLLDVQVFRRSGNLWLETTITDKWTLERQNTHGREITESFFNPRLRDFNYDRTNDGF